MNNVAIYIKDKYSHLINEIQNKCEFIGVNEIEVFEPQQLILGIADDCMIKHLESQKQINKIIKL